MGGSGVETKGGGGKNQRPRREKKLEEEEEEEEENVRCPGRSEKMISIKRRGMFHST